jgi:hypothetical protein
MNGLIVHRTNCIYKGMWYGTILSPHNTKIQYALYKNMLLSNVSTLVELEGRKNIAVDKSIIVIPYFAEFR